jgi:hypothetical protein
MATARTSQLTRPDPSEALTLISLGTFFRSDARCCRGSHLPSEVVERALLSVSVCLIGAHGSTQHGTGHFFMMALNPLCWRDGAVSHLHPLRLRGATEKY